MHQHRSSSFTLYPIAITIGSTDELDMQYSHSTRLVEKKKREKATTHTKKIVGESKSIIPGIKNPNLFFLSSLNFVWALRRALIQVICQVLTPPVFGFTLPGTCK